MASQVPYVPRRNAFSIKLSLLPFGQFARIHSIYATMQANRTTPICKTVCVEKTKTTGWDGEANRVRSASHCARSLLRFTGCRLEETKQPSNHSACVWPNPESHRSEHPFVLEQIQIASIHQLKKTPLRLTHFLCVDERHRPREPISAQRWPPNQDAAPPDAEETRISKGAKRDSLASQWHQAVLSLARLIQNGRQCTERVLLSLISCFTRQES